MGFVVDPVKRVSANSEYVSGKGTLYRQKSTPAANSNTSVHAAVTLPASGTTVVTTGITNPGVPRVARIVGNAAGIAGNVVVAGLDQFGAAQTDTIALSATTPVDGVIAFRTITSITFPAKTNASGDTVSVGVGQAIGADRALSDPNVLYATYNGVLESTAATVVLAHNTVSLNTTLAGSAVVIVYVHVDLTHL